MGAFLDAFHRRQRRLRAQRFLDQKIANRIAWSAPSRIEDLRDPSGESDLFPGRLSSGGIDWHYWRTPGGDIL